MSEQVARPFDTGQRCRIDEMHVESEDNAEREEARDEIDQLFLHDPRGSSASQKGIVLRPWKVAEETGSSEEEGYPRSFGQFGLRVRGRSKRWRGIVQDERDDHGEEARYSTAEIDQQIGQLVERTSFEQERCPW